MSKMIRAGAAVHGFLYRRGLAHPNWWLNIVASGKGYANYPKKTSRVIPLGFLRPVS